MLVPDYAAYMDTQQSINLKIRQLFESEGIGANGPDDTYGNFDPDRMEGLYDAVVPIMDAQGVDLPDGFDAESAYTNEFIDDSIGL